MFADMTYQDSNAMYNRLIRETVGQLPGNVTLIDIESAFHKKMESKEYSLKQLLLPDNLHLRELGHDVYVEVVGSNLLARIGYVMLPDW